MYVRELGRNMKMSIIGKIHEISLYGLIANIICLINGKTSFSMLGEAAFSPDGIDMFFQCYLFWASVLYIPVAIVGAIITRFIDDGEGLLFKSDNVFVIIFAHIAEELLGLFLTPIWFIKDLITGDLDEDWKMFDYITYAMELVFILLGFFVFL